MALVKFEHVCSVGVVACLAVKGVINLDGKQFQVGTRCVGIAAADRYQVERKCINIRAESSKDIVQASTVVLSCDN